MTFEVQGEHTLSTKWASRSLSRTFRLLTVRRLQKRRPPWGTKARTLRHKFFLCREETKHLGFRKTVVSIILAAMVITAALVGARADAKSATVKGYVLDSACAFIKNLKKPVSPDCALACAKAGSPLVILADDGSIYWPISSSMPATSQNQRLMKFAGQRVTASGRVYERGGSRALIIEKIEAASAGK